MELRAEKRYDKNNRLVTRHIKVEQDPKQNTFLNLLKPLASKEARVEKKRRGHLIETFSQQAFAEYAKEREVTIAHDKQKGSTKGYDEGLDNATERIEKRLKQLSLGTLELLEQYPPAQGINEFTRGYFEEAAESIIRESIMYPKSKRSGKASEWLHELTQTEDLSEFGEDTDEHHRIKAVYEVTSKLYWAYDHTGARRPTSEQAELEFTKVIWDHPDRCDEIIDFGMQNWGQSSYKEGDIERLNTYLDHPVRALADGAL
jgi:hypothetical protein